MKVLVHIGQSKTGTSAIQAFLTLNRDLLSSHGVLYPAIKINNMALNLGAHNAVADALLGHVRFPYFSADEYFRQFFDDAEKEKSDLLILSAEHFFGGEPRVWDVGNEDEYFKLYRNKIENLAKYLKGHEVGVLVYLRPQVDWVESAISQTVRIERLISEYKIYKNDRDFFTLMKPLLKYADILDVWKEVICPSHFSVIPYDRKTLCKGSSIADFLKRANLEHIIFDYGDSNIQVNVSLNREFIEVKKMLNSTLRSKNEERIIIRCLENLSRDNPSSSKYTIDPDVKYDIVDFVKEQNERINSLYIQEGLMPLKSSSNNVFEVKPSEFEIDRAYVAYKSEFKHFKYIFIGWRFLVLSFLRAHAKPIHAALHQIKVMYWSWKYKC